MSDGKKGKPERAAELRAKGLTAEEIAMAMGVSVRSVWRYLHEEAKIERKRGWWIREKIGRRLGDNHMLVIATNR